jgi:hypothetical protein
MSTSGSRDANAEEGTQYALPTKATVEKAGKDDIYDTAGKAIAFNSLYSAELGEHKRVMVIFIRHFFCGVGRFYPVVIVAADKNRYVKSTLRTLAAGISPSSLPQDVSILIRMRRSKPDPVL